MNFLHTFAVVLVAGAFSWTFVGCSPGTKTEQTSPAEHIHLDGHREPETLTEAVEVLSELHQEIQTAFSKADHKAADEALHKIGHMLGEVPVLALKSKLTSDQATVVKSATDELFTLYGKIDERMHGGEGATYEESANKLSVALAALRKAVPVSPTPAKP